MKAAKILRWIAPLLIASVWVGCNGQPDSEGSEPAASPKETPGASLSQQPSQEALIILAKADAVDGAEDKVVGKCLTCALGMAGSADHASEFGPYELHLCSKTCKKSFDAEPEQAVLAAKLPAPE